MPVHTSKILIIDFGSQTTQLIARRVREMGTYCEIVPYDVSADVIKTFAPNGIILSGGPSSITQAQTPRANEVIFSLGCPILGICYGMQSMAEQLGGVVCAGGKREFGFAKVRLQGHSSLLATIEDDVTAQGQSLLDVWMSHGDQVTSLPPGFVAIASTDSAPVAAMADESRQYYGVQFHPEVTHTKQGQRLLQRFVQTICACQNDWTAANIVQEIIDNVRLQVGNDRVVLGLSGGVDSSVLASLLHHAIGAQLYCVFVDTGLLRCGDKERVINVIGQHMGIDVIIVDAKDRFMQALQGRQDPEEKRKIIGKEFVDVFQQEASKLVQVKWLAQGTIYSDVIESAGNKLAKGHVIKSHHNVGGLPEKMDLRLLEPLRELFKDEVRKIGLELGLPSEMLFCHPFPGPGLGVRILGEVTALYAELLRRCDDIFITELRAKDLYDSVSQAFAVFLPVKSVAVMGDGREYDYVIALRAVVTEDFMTANWARLPYDFLAHVANRIINEVPGISRVTYDISSKPPATIEWE